MQPSYDFKKVLDEFYAVAMLHNDYTIQLDKIKKYPFWDYYNNDKTINGLTRKETEYIIHKYRLLNCYIVNGFRTGRIKYYTLNNKDFVQSRLRKYSFYFIAHGKTTKYKGISTKRIAKLIKHNRYKYEPQKSHSIKMCNYYLKELNEAFLYKFWEEMQLRR